MMPQFPLPTTIPTPPYFQHQQPPSMMSMEDVERMMRMNMRPLAPPEPQSFPVQSIPVFLPLQTAVAKVESHPQPSLESDQVIQRSHSIEKQQQHPSKGFKELQIEQETQEVQEKIETPTSDGSKRQHMGKLNRQTQSERKKNQQNSSKRGNREYQHHQFQHESSSDVKIRRNRPVRTFSNTLISRIWNLIMD